MYPPPPERSAFDGLATDKHTIETPEQLGLHFAVAGVGSRFLALAIDTLIQIAMGIGLGIGVALLVGFGAWAGLAGPSVWVLAAAGFGVFLLMYGYFAIFEIVWNGQTPGKKIIGIRVMKDSGRPLTAAETIGRNLMRIVDQLPACYAIGVVTALVSPRNQRLGDLVAGAIVVRESAAGARAPWLTTQSAGPVTPGVQTAHGGAAQISLEDLALIDTFLNRRNDMQPDVRSKMAAQIYARLRANIELHDEGKSAEFVIEEIARQRRGTYGGV